MREFRLRKIEPLEQQMFVEIEFLDNGDRRNFFYPFGKDWEEEINGTPKIVIDIAKTLENETKQKNSRDQAVTFKSKWENKKITSKLVEQGKQNHKRKPTFSKAGRCFKCENDKLKQICKKKTCDCVVCHKQKQ